MEAYSWPAGAAALIASISALYSPLCIVTEAVYVALSATIPMGST